jgi:hypothetical protein
MFTPPGLAPTVTEADVPNGPSDMQIALDQSPDQNAAVANIAQNAAQQAVPAAQPQESRWARVLKGALAGLAEGGIPGAIGGAVDPNAARQAYQQQGQIRQARAQVAQAAAQSATQQVQFGRDDHNVQMAQAQLNLLHLQALSNGQIPADFRAHLLEEGAEASQHLASGGISPVFTGSEADADAHLKARMATNSDNPLGTVMLPSANGDGQFSVYEIPSNSRTYSHDVNITIGYNADGSPIRKLYPAGSISVAQGLATESAALVDQAKLQAKIAFANATGVTAKNQGAANKANAAASGTGSTKVENLLVGMDDAGNQVAGTKDELAGVGVKNISKLPAADASKVVAARELVSPDGLFSLIAKDMAALGPQGLDAVGSRFNEFMAGNVGAGNDNYTRLRTHVRLLSSALMQAHVGSRGSEAMLEEFRGLADQGKMNSKTLTAALAAEYDYVHGRALLPRKAAK